MPVPVGKVAAALLAGSCLVGVVAFGWPFLVDPGSGLAHSRDAPWLFALLLALLAGSLLAGISAGGLDAKAVALLGVLASAGAALRVLGAGIAGLDPMFILLVLAGRVLGRGGAFLLGALSMLAGAFLTGGVGPWTPFQMFAAGWVALGAACLPRARGRAELALLAGYGLLAGLGYGLVMNLWFWPFLGAGAPSGAAFAPGDPVTDNLARYAAFYLLTSLGWDLPRGLLTAAGVLVAGRPVLATLRRALRRAAFAAPVAFDGPLAADEPLAAEEPVAADEPLADDGLPRRTLVLGPARSGKSRTAQDLLRGYDRVVYVATGSPPTPDDPEWAARVEAHRADRPDGWEVVESTDVAGVLRERREPVLVDCLTLWLTAVLTEVGAWDDRPGWQERLERRAGELEQAWRQRDGVVVAVSNEVGWGVVPATASGRLFRDALGSLHQRLAATGTRVLLVVAGRVLDLPAAAPSRPPRSGPAER